MRYVKHATVVVAIAMCAVNLAHAELVQQFKNPAFSGIGFSSHVLTIESIEKSRRDAIESTKKSTEQALINEANNTPLARFMNLFQSQVYAQLSTQLSNNLFKDNCQASDGGSVPGCVNPTTGSFVLDNNTVSWVKSPTAVSLTVVDQTGTVTTVSVPLASFSF